MLNKIKRFLAKHKIIKCEECNKRFFRKHFVNTWEGNPYSFEERLLCFKNEEGCYLELVESVEGY
jgi:uncharacterized Zn-finger protein